MDWFECLNKDDKVGTEVGTDGPSLPILTIYIKAGKRSTFVFLGKEQTEKLVRDLQRKLAEM